MGCVPSMNDEKAQVGGTPQYPKALSYNTNKSTGAHRIPSIPIDHRLLLVPAILLYHNRHRVLCHCVLLVRGSG